MLTDTYLALHRRILPDPGREMPHWFASLGLRGEAIVVHAYDEAAARKFLRTLTGTEGRFNGVEVLVEPVRLWKK